MREIDQAVTFGAFQIKDVCELFGIEQVLEYDHVHLDSFGSNGRVFHQTDAIGSKDFGQSARFLQQNRGI